MNLLFMLIIGGVIGWLAAKVAGRDEGLVASVIIGVVGSLIGGFLASLLIDNVISLSFNWSGLFWSFIGSLVLVTILNLLQHRSPHHPL